MCSPWSRGRGDRSRHELIARVVDGRVVIDRDVNNKPLVGALLQPGVPRRLAYAGETVTDAAGRRTSRWLRQVPAQG